MKTYWSLNESVLWQTLYTLVDLERLRSVDCGWFHCGIFFFAWFFVRLHVYAPWRWTRKVEQHWWSILVLALSQPLTSKGNERVPLLLIEIFPILQKISWIIIQKNLLNQRIWFIGCFFVLLVLKHEETKQYKNSINVFNNNMEISVFIFVSRKRRRGMERLMGLKP